MTPKATIVSSREIGAANTMSPHDFLEGEPRHACHLCGLSPVNVEKRGRTNPRTALLELAGPDKRDPLKRSLYRCQDRAACDGRVRHAKLKGGDA